MQLQPSKTDAVLGGSQPPPIYGAVLGGKEGTLARVATRPDIAIAEPFSQKVLLPGLCRYFFKNATAPKSNNKSFGNSSLIFKNLTLYTRKGNSYGNLVSVLVQGLHVGSLFRPRLLFEDVIQFLPPIFDRPETNRWQQICQFVLETAIAINNGRESDVLLLPLNHHQWWITLSNRTVLEVKATSNWQDACKVAAQLIAVHYGGSVELLRTARIVKVDAQTSEGRETVTTERI